MKNIEQITGMEFIMYGPVIIGKKRREDINYMLKKDAIELDSSCKDDKQYIKLIKIISDKN